MNRFGVLIFLNILIAIGGCTEKLSNKKNLTLKEVQLDTIYLQLENEQDYGLYFVSDTLTKNKLIPRNTWVTFCPVSSGEISHLLKHADLYLESPDSNLIINRVNNKKFKVFINEFYEGRIFDEGSVAGQECLTMHSIVIPNEGYIISTYWNKRPTVHPNRSNLLMHYETIEMKK